MTAPHLIVFGLGDTGSALAAAAARVGLRVTGLSRNPTAALVPQGVAVAAFADAAGVVREATHLVSTAPPTGDGGEGDWVDPVLHAHAGAIEAAPKLHWIGYFSTTGVYGDRGGDWVDEATPPAPSQPRSERRLAAEAAWAAFADRRAVDIFRIAGIYGPGRSALDELRAGRARRIVKPGHAFGRIHRDDIIFSVLAAVGQHRPAGVRILNLNDDEPAEPALVVEEAARLLGVAPPPAVPFAEAEPRMSFLARSFWAENRRVSSAATQAALGIRWKFPSFREGLAAILAEEGGDGPAQ